MTKNKPRISNIHHLRSTVKRERFFAQVYFSNETVSRNTVSTGPMKMITWAACVPVRCIPPNLITLSVSIFLKSQWHQASKTLKNVVNFVKPALHGTKTCYISLTNIHSLVLQTKHFHWFSRNSCLGNCLIWKVNLREKTFTLHGWTQMVVSWLLVISTIYENIQ